MNTNEIESALELSYLKCIESGDVPDCLLVSKEIALKIKSRYFITAKIFYSDLFCSDNYIFSKSSMLIDILDFNSDCYGFLNDKIAIAISKEFKDNA